MREWQGVEGAIGREVAEQNRKCLATYREDHNRVTQDANIESQIFEGGYSERQLFELIQNAADALHDARGRVEVRLTTDTLYVANEGRALSTDGLVSLMASHISKKESDQIGRFGLGFKSVLAVSDSPQVFSRSGSFGFNAESTRRRIKELVPGLDKYPATRLAEVLSFEAEAALDEHLRELGEWATTIVRLPLRARRDELSAEMRDFPTEFVLFSPQIESVAFDDRLVGTRREIVTREGRDGSVILRQGSQESRWVVCQVKHRPSREALLDGGYRAARDEVTVQWAAPVGGGSGLGEFWAYFPTKDKTTLSGTINAPWKLTEDRLTLLEGAFNEEILTEVLPKLVAMSLHAIATDDNPCAVIDAMPARGREPRSWGDAVLNSPVMSALGKAPSIPDLTGKLRPPSGLRLHPDGISTEILAVWSSACPEPGKWVHHGVGGDERRSKVLRLLNAAGSDAVDVATWLESLIGGDEVAGSIAALTVAAQLLNEGDVSIIAGISRAKIVLLEDGTMHVPGRGRVFVRSHGDDTSGHLFIHSRLAESPEARGALSVLGISILDAAGEYRHALQESPPRWIKAWDASRTLPVDTAVEITKEIFTDGVLSQVEARTIEGQWRPISQVFLPGAVIPGDGSRDRKFVVDGRFHHRDMELLTALGAVSSPIRGGLLPDEPFMTAMRDELRELYRKKYDPRTPDNQIDVTGPPLAWPMDVLPRLSGQGRQALTTEVLKLGPADDWEVRNRRQPSKSLRVESPTWRWLRSHGRLSTPLGPVPPSWCVRSSDELDGEPLPCATEVSDHVLEQLQSPTMLEDLPAAAWEWMLEQAATWPDGNRRTRLYAWAGETGVEAPTLIVAQGARGPVKVHPTAAAVTDDNDLFTTLVAADIATLLCEPEDLAGLLSNWGCADGREMLQEEVQYEPAGEARVLLDSYPPLSLYAGNLDLPQSLVLQPCKSLTVLTSTPQGQTSRSLPVRRDGNVVYVTAADERGMLQQALSALKLAVNADDVLRSMARQKQRKLRSDITRANGTEAKLLLAVGADELRRNLPRPALKALAAELGRELDEQEIARLAVSVHGYALLQVHRQALSERKLDPPSTWAGTTSARRWVAELGFPSEFAGFAGRSRPPVYEVEGPVALPPLHDYQRVVADSIKRMLGPHSESSRGMVSLPTGAGKTRVAVEALVEHFTGRGDDQHLIWIAQSDELCEQAVQTEQ